MLERLDPSRLLLGLAAIVGLVILVLWWSGGDDPGEVEIGSATSLVPDEQPTAPGAPDGGEDPQPPPAEEGGPPSSPPEGGQDPQAPPTQDRDPPTEPPEGEEDPPPPPPTDGSERPPPPPPGERGGPWPSLPDDADVGAVITPTGVVVAVEAADGSGYRAISPCGNDVVVEGEPLRGAHVVLDPGHGGVEPGTEGPTGLVEAELNLQVAEEVKRRLEQTGATVVLTRTDDYWVTIPARMEIGSRLDPELFVSIHHNSDPAGRSQRPGTETYFPGGSPEARRAAGLLWEELVDTLSGYDVDWASNEDAGAKYRSGEERADYFGILRIGGGVPAVLVEAAFLTNPAEEALLRDPEVVAAEAEAITRAAIRFMTTEDEGSGFVDPEDQSGGHGAEVAAPDCEDPPLR